ncbi:hypothetical protein B0T10DRAFT_548261 [Thelonectria olida]|uniref:Zn(2)-C6 fungal-type domain-containing protein n=1 Tax=Thelonectria olida TaxID=1576542 RepID=A0A9P8W6T7_9HYPO|nr:hypothetical protein B0T10DRAFT_548261 [Thelonectria olida]
MALKRYGAYWSSTAASGLISSATDGWDSTTVLTYSTLLTRALSQTPYRGRTLFRNTLAASRNWRDKSATFPVTAITLYQPFDTFDRAPNKRCSVAALPLDETIPSGPGAQTSRQPRLTKMAAAKPSWRGIRQQDAPNRARRPNPTPTHGAARRRPRQRLNQQHTLQQNPTTDHPQQQLPLPRLPPRLPQGSQGQGQGPVLVQPGAPIVSLATPSPNRDAGQAQAIEYDPPWAPPASSYEEQPPSPVARRNDNAREQQSHRSSQRLTACENPCRDTNPRQHPPASGTRRLAQEHGVKQGHGHAANSDNHHDETNPAVGRLQSVYSRPRPPQADVDFKARLVKPTLKPTVDLQGVPEADTLFLRPERRYHADRVRARLGPKFTPGTQQTALITSRPALLPLSPSYDSVGSSSSTRTLSSETNFTSTALTEYSNTKRSLDDCEDVHQTHTPEHSEWIETDELNPSSPESTDAESEEEPIISEDEDSFPPDPLQPERRATLPDDPKSLSGALAERNTIGPEPFGTIVGSPYECQCRVPEFPLPPEIDRQLFNSEVAWLTPDEYDDYNDYAIYDAYDVSDSVQVCEDFDRESIKYLSGIESEDEEMPDLVHPDHRTTYPQNIRPDKSPPPPPPRPPSNSNDSLKGPSNTTPTQQHQQQQPINENSKNTVINLIEENISHVKKNKRLLACIRCRMQKIKCVWDPRIPHGSCVGCRDYDKWSKRTLHRVPCMRHKLSEVQIFRKGGLGLTKRWAKPTMKDVGDRIPGVMPRLIHVLQMCSDEPIDLKVVKFMPREGDVGARYWTVIDGGIIVRKKTELGHWCLEDINAAADVVEAYIKRNAIPALRKHIRQLLADHPVPSSALIARVYASWIEMYSKLSAKSASQRSMKEETEVSLLGNLFVLWLSMRLSTGSSWLDAAETLGMKPDTDNDNPMGPKVALPRMIVAQFDNVNCAKIIPKYRKRVIGILDILIFQGNPQSWYILFVTLFVILREATWTSADRYRHARHNYGSSIRYSIPDFVQELQHGCNNLVAHWNYYNKHPWPRSGKDEERLRSSLSDLSPEQFNLVMDTRKNPEVLHHQAMFQKYIDRSGCFDPEQRRQAPEYAGVQDKMNWDSPLYWVAQLVESDWSPHPTYFSEAIPKRPPLLIEETSQENSYGTETRLLHESRARMLDSNADTTRTSHALQQGIFYRDTRHAEETTGPIHSARSAHLLAESHLPCTASDKQQGATSGLLQIFHVRITSSRMMRVLFLERDMFFVCFLGRLGPKRR